MLLVSCRSISQPARAVVRRDLPARTITLIWRGLGGITRRPDWQTGRVLTKFVRP